MSVNIIGQVVNKIKLAGCLKVCHENGTEHDQLLLHTDVRWLSRGKTLLRLYELRNEVFVFLTEHLHPLAVQLEDGKWVARLAYLADVFTKLNELNPSLQGKESHILKLYGKVQGFTKKLKLWERKCDEGDVSCFPLLNAHPATTAVARGPVVKLVQAHLSKLCTDFSHYFQDIENKSERLDWVRNPFIVSASSSSLPAMLQEPLME
ncbi:hypothetical protein JOQ06_004146 [Pogonophryne albipinna]|uniref:Uncharacterized protein n=1 Tax=Pogonophryne albipinna TaxID=1090488 RepID=A0AAD6ACX9_9TELE|nr:hypothetical protein JOQ06_004146 [Pogonophryne albipinna]